MLKHRIIVITAILLVAICTVALVDIIGFQEPSEAQVIWKNNYGGQGDDRAFYALSNNGGYLIIGSTQPLETNRTMGWVLQIDSNGEIIWSKTYLQGFGTELRYALNLTDGYLLVGNEFSETNNVNGLVIKIDKNGNTIWNATIGNEKVSKLFSAFRAQDDFILVGLTYPKDDSNSEGWASKIDSEGQIVWNCQYSIGIDTALRQGVTTTNGDYILAGYTQTDIYRFLALKIDSDGKLIWNQTYGQGNSQKAYAIAKQKDGYIIAGDKISSKSDSDMWLLKIDWNGDIIWDKAFGGKMADSAASITNTKDGNCLVTGFTFSYGEGNRDVWVLKVSESGSLIWSRTIGDSGYQEAYQVLEVDKNQYIIAGWTDPPGQPELIGKAQYDFFVAKLSP